MFFTLENINSRRGNKSKKKSEFLLQYLKINNITTQKNQSKSKISKFITTNQIKLLFLFIYNVYDLIFHNHFPLKSATHGTNRRGRGKTSNKLNIEPEEIEEKEGGMD